MLAMGIPSKRELLRRVSGWELTEWAAYYQLEPWGESRADLRAAITDMVIANWGKGAEDTLAEVSDFMPNYEDDKEDDGGQTLEEQYAMVSTWAGMLGAKRKD
jgi:hypothetical protein